MISETEVDSTGRILIPREILAGCQIVPNMRVGIEVKNGKIVLFPVEKLCIVCHNAPVSRSCMPYCKSCVIKGKYMRKS